MAAYTALDACACSQARFISRSTPSANAFSTYGFHQFCAPTPSCGWLPVSRRTGGRTRLETIDRAAHAKRTSIHNVRLHHRGAHEMMGERPDHRGRENVGRSV